MEMDGLKGYIKDLLTDSIETKASVRALTDDAREIKTALLGDDKFKRKGIVHEFEELKTTVNGHGDEIKKINDRHFKTVVTAGAVSGGIGVAGGMGFKAVLAKLSTFLMLK